MNPPLPPDLLIYSSDIVFSDVTPNPGETVTIEATVHNVGNGDANDVSVTFLLDRAIPIETATVAFIPAGGSQDVVTEWVASQPGAHVVKVVVDVLVDSNKNNNIATRAIIVAPGELEAPVAILTAEDEVVNLGADVLLRGTNSYDPDGPFEELSFFYDLDNGETSGWIDWPQVGLTWQYYVPGEYWPRLMVRDGDGLLSDWSEPVNITVLPEPGFPEAILDVYPQTQQVGQQLTFDASASTDSDGVITEYKFEFGNGDEQWSSTPVISYNYSVAGEYYPRVLVVDDTGLEAWSKKITVTIAEEPPPEPDFEISVSPDKQTAQPYSFDVEYQVTIISKNGFSSPVAIEADISPMTTEMEWTVIPDSVTPPANGIATSTLKINVYDAPLKTYTITITATGGGITPEPVEARLSVERRLEVPYQNQGFTEWCGPSSLAMVLRYYGIRFHSWEYVDPIFGPPSESLPVYIGRLNAFVLAHCPWLTPIEGYYSSTEDAHGRILDDIQSNITSGFPVILRLYAPGHFVVVTGFNESGIYINDPSGAVFTSAFLNKPSVVNYHHAFLNWEDWESLKQFIHPWYALGPDILCIQNNNPQPTEGTLYFFGNGDIQFFAQDSEDDYSFLDLDFGLSWKTWDPAYGKARLSNIISSMRHYLYWSVRVSNTYSFARSFTLSFHIVDDEGHRCFSEDIERTVEGYDNQIFASPTSDIGENLLESGLYCLEFYLWNQEGRLVDSFSSPYFYYLVSGWSFRLQENQQHLYLHVYDEFSRHVGMNFSTNEVDLEIPNSYYFDTRNGTIEIAVPALIAHAAAIMNLTIVIDAEYAENPLESYNLTVISRGRDGNILNFTAVDIPIRTSAMHSFEIDWAALSLGEEGVTIQVDSDGDGSFEHTFTSDSELTLSEYVIGTDGTRPETWHNIDEPKFVVNDTIYLTSDTPIELIAEDNLGGSGVASTAYRIYNATYDSGWTNYTEPFRLIGLGDGAYQIGYNSTDIAGNVEPSNNVTVNLDNTGPSITVENPPPGWALQDGVTFMGSIVDSGSGVSSMCFSIRESNGDEGTPIGFECLPVSYDPITGEWSFSFDTLLVPDGNYSLHIEAEDNLGNETSTTVPYSIRNWAVIELLPSSEDNKAGRTMPVKFALRVAAEVDPNQPFVYNEELRIEISATADPDNILQESYYGDTARDYRISSVLYVTNFRTVKREPMEYTVAIYRDTFDVGSFTFETAK